MNEKKTFYREFFQLMLPLSFQTLMTTMISATDALVLARLSQNAIAAVSLAAELTFILHLFISAVTSTLSILASQYLGKGDRNTVGRVWGMAVRLNLVLAGCFFLAAQFAPDLLMRIYSSDAEIVQIGADYLRVASWSYLLVALTQAVVSILHVTNHAHVCAVTTAITAVTDVIVDIFLVYGLMGLPKLGAVGTAYSTVAVCALELLCVTVYCIWKGNLPIHLNNVRDWNALLFQDFLKIGMPVLISGLVWGVGYSLNSAVMGHLGADSAAANSIAALIRNLFTCFIRGAGIASGIMVGKKLGASAFEDAKLYGGRLTRISLLIGTLSGVACIALGTTLARFFILSEAARALLAQMFPICGIYLVAKSMNATVTTYIFPAGGDSKYDAVSTSIATWIFALPLGCLAAFVWKAPVVLVYLLLCMDEIGKAPFIYPHYMKFGWLKNVTREFN